MLPSARQVCRSLSSTWKSSALSSVRKLQSTIDLRSDTVTQPSQKMRDAMASALVGDDVYREDPTVNELERVAAELLGKEEAIFVPTGCMGNAIAIASHCRRGDELICGDRSHIFNYEGGNASTLFGVAIHTVKNQDNGALDLDDVVAAIRPDDPHFARTSLLCLENTHNMCGGKVLPKEYLQQARNLCDEHGLRFHLDGARVANAATALNMSLKDLVAPVHSVNMCLSKGLGAPVGSVLAGSAELMYYARRTRKLLGGGMRQAGVLAAAGLIALQENIHRLHVDHTNAKHLAKNLASIDGILIDPESVQSNIVVFRLASPFKCSDYVSMLKQNGVLVGLGYDTSAIRAVTHLDVSDADIDDASERFSIAMQQLRS
eukprot:m.49085 g.49085  ORF g.49085 m.49085 type:complete len:376 (+) comp12446_c0_seq2:41-1168(+)